MLELGFCPVPWWAPPEILLRARTELMYKSLGITATELTGSCQHTFSSLLQS